MADKVQQEMGLLANWYTGNTSFGTAPSSSFSTTLEKTGTNACA